ncbi:hypothetical protein QO004_005057 [Rhizobium mesoamericanum]|uniref:hypothetical protein n=1 Tax=Rhizobium mesoamericanum TaxID=1079800 RepID=UPI00277D5EDF|nr:hypothetical protein [Rhizobium mesoamericanum]MDQ0563248.1 hypothetical protein [Rhizobium mesoamericanum]
MTEKFLWVVTYKSLDDFKARAQKVKATAVAIRSDNNLSKAIKEFGSLNPKIKVFAWRWPSHFKDPLMNEAQKIVNLFAEGLDGYFVDPEKATGKNYDWDLKNLDGLATEFMDTLRNAAVDRTLGVTSHYLAKSTWPSLPWKAFFEKADVLLPQSYWRSTAGTIGHGDPSDNYKVGIDRWSKAGGEPAKIIPMAGELGTSKPTEIDEYVQAANAAGRRQLHFYAWGPEVSEAVWDRVAAASVETSPLVAAAE